MKNYNFTNFTKKTYERSQKTTHILALQNFFIGIPHTGLPRKVKELCSLVLRTPNIGPK
jgi:hypothetical protein